MCFMVNIHVFGCRGVPWGVVECHGVISSTGYNRPGQYSLKWSILVGVVDWNFQVVVFL